MANLPKQPTWQVQPRTRARARALRRDLTDAERIIWNALRAHRLNGAGFRRQTPIGPYIVDFVCHEAKLVIELDGGQHFEAEHLAKDARRDAFLEGRGFSVLRFNNHDVMTNRSGVLETIAAALGRGAAEAPGRGQTPSLPSPASGGGIRPAQVSGTSPTGKPKGATRRGSRA
jgi:very-short-patch-repair endonuclease